MEILLVPHPVLRQKANKLKSIFREIVDEKISKMPYCTNYIKEQISIFLC